MKVILSLILGFLALVPNARATDVNVRVAPINLLIGMISVDTDIAISEAWTLGPQFQYMNVRLLGFDIQAYGIGVRGNYYFNGTALTQGWYFGPSVNYINVKVTEDDDDFGDLEGKASGFSVTGLFGYQWMWETFNINLGAGPTYYTIGKIDVENDDGSEDDDYGGYDGLSLALEFTLGWKF